MTKVFAGDTTREGSASSDAWKQFGFNIDGFVTDCSGHDCRLIERHCRPRAGAFADVFEDGDDGIDNSFGFNITPIFSGLQADPGPSGTVDAEIARGAFTLLIAIDGLGPDSGYNPLAARFYDGARLPSRPKLDGTDVWPIAQSSLEDPTDIKSALFRFPKSWVAHDTWVSGEGDLTVFVLWSGQRFAIPLHHAVVAMNLAPGRDAATEGVISGTVDPDVLADQFHGPLGAIDPSLCNGNTVASILRQVRSAADIMIDGRLGSPDETCNGVSVGLGFEAVRVELGDVVADPVRPDPCAK